MPVSQPRGLGRTRPAYARPRRMRGGIRKNRVPDLLSGNAGLQAAFNLRFAPVPHTACRQVCRSKARLNRVNAHLGKTRPAAQKSYARTTPATDGLIVRRCATVCRSFCRGLHIPSPSTRSSMSEQRRARPARLSKVDTPAPRSAKAVFRSENYVAEAELTLPSTPAKTGEVPKSPTHLRESRTD